MKRFFSAAAVAALLTCALAGACAQTYTYEFEGMMGREQAQIELLEDGSCTFCLSGNPMIRDTYAGTYTRQENTVTITDLANTDKQSAFPQPALWDWIVDGNAVITVDDAASAFTPESVGAPAAAQGLPERAPLAEDEPQDCIRVAYAENSASQICDIYLPDQAEKAPVIVLVHGGGFLFGDSQMDIIKPVIAAARQRGYAVVSVDYRKSSEAVFPAALSDVKAAVRFVKANAEQYGFDSDKIAVWGESAGAYLALMTALTAGESSLDGDVTVYPDVSSSVQALVSFYAPVEFYTLYAEAGKPEAAASSFETRFMGFDVSEDESRTAVSYWETYASAVDPALKVMIQAGSADSKVPCTQSENLAARLQNVLPAQNVTLEIFQDAEHEDERFYTPENLSAVLTWLDDALGR